jgi:hypothetical protein
LIRTLPVESHVMAVDAIFNSLVFYSERKVSAVRRLDRAAATLAAPEPAALLTKERNLARLRCRLRTDVFVWWRGETDKLLVVNRPPPPGEAGETLAPLPPAACEGAGGGERLPQSKSD